MDDSFIGPRKPASLTLTVDAVRRLYARVNPTNFKKFVEDNGAAFPWEEIHDPSCDCIPPDEKTCCIDHWTHIRLTFIDDDHAAEFALRYA